MKTLADYLSAERGRQARLAAAIGVSPGYLSDVANGKKPGSVKLYRSISEATGLPMSSLIDEAEAETGSSATETPYLEFGFSEPDVSPYRAHDAQQGKQAMDLARQLAPDGRHLMIYSAQRDFAAFSMLRGDLLVIGTPTQSRPGDLVVASLSDGEPFSGITVLRQRVGNTLVPPVSGGVSDEGSLSHSILGTVLAVIRSPAFS